MQKKALKNRILALLLACLMLTGLFAIQKIERVYAEPEEPTVTEEVTEEPETTEETAPETTPAAAGNALITAADEDEEEDEGTAIDSLLNEDRVWLQKFNKIVIQLAAVLGILLVCVIIITIYIMITRTTRLTKQNKQLSRGKERPVRHEPVSAMPQTEEQITEFGDTLRIKRAVTQSNAAGQRKAAPANMQRPSAPQRPSRPTQGQGQPGVRRPAYTGQPTRSTTPTGQPTRGTTAGGQIRQPQRPTASSGYGQPVRRTRPAAPDNYRQLHRTPTSVDASSQQSRNSD